MARANCSALASILGSIPHASSSVKGLCFQVIRHLYDSSTNEDGNCFIDFVYAYLILFDMPG